ncbi:hypothetical protein PVK06_007734 [Gossypium arboreum]|uniref:Uncharacterized protein n=1 Tax=Gossypium arboreum TaxID=29729 RepID=A0ABR0QJ34_GOSAR|nr:hypothetical protein PVK06_007734 [Gossypium arboreum]
MKAAGDRFFFRLDVEQVQWMSKPPKAITKLRPLGYDVILSGPLPNLRILVVAIKGEGLKRALIVPMRAVAVGWSTVSEARNQLALKRRLLYWLSLLIPKIEFATLMDLTLSSQSPPQEPSPNTALSIRSSIPTGLKKNPFSSSGSSRLFSWRDLFNGGQHPSLQSKSTNGRKVASLKS